MELDHSQLLKRLHTEKSIMIQKYQPVTAANYDIEINPRGLENAVRVLYQNGHSLLLEGEKYGLNFLHMEQPRLVQTVEKVLETLEKAQQEKLWQDTELDAYTRIHPIEGSKLPYFVLEKNEFCRFAYCPIADDKFAVLVHNDFGNLFMGTDHRAFGSYDNELKPMLTPEDQLDSVKIASILYEYEPAAVWGYEEQYVLKKLEQMTLETNARPFILTPNEPDTNLSISLPEEIEDYLSPSETELAKKLIILHEDSLSDPVEIEPDEAIVQSDEEEPLEDFEPEMNM